MAGDGRLTNIQYVQLSEAISGSNMVSIAQGFLDLDSDTIASIREDNNYKAGASNRAMIKRWADQPKNQRDQTRNLARLLYDAAAEGSYCDPYKIQKILRFSEEEARATPDTVLEKQRKLLSTMPNGTAVPVGRALTAKMLYNLSRHLSDEGDLRRLATTGLETAEHVLDGHINQDRNITEATLGVLKEWQKGYRDMTLAYTDLCQILRKVEMSLYIANVLEKD